MQSYVISENNALLSELCAGARNVASDVTAVVFGDGAAAAECGADHILTCPLEESGSPEDFAKAIAEEILKSDAACVLVGNTILGRALAGKLSVYLNTAVFATISSLTSEDGKPCFERTVFGGTAVNKQVIETAYSVFTVNSGIFAAAEGTGACTDIAPIAGAASASLKRVSKDEKRETAVNLVAENVSSMSAVDLLHRKILLCVRSWLLLSMVKLDVPVQSLRTTNGYQNLPTWESQVFRLSQILSSVLVYPDRFSISVVSTNPK